MSEVGAYEAKTNLPRLLKRVAKGERITITKHGVPVAKLVPPHQGRRRPVADVLADLRRFSRGKRLRDLDIGRWPDLADRARRNRVTAYDGTYLDLALQLGLPLASSDEDLRTAAAAAGVAVYGA